MRLKIGAERYHNRSQPFFNGLGMMNPHLPYHFPAEYADMYPAPEAFPIAAHPTLDTSQSTVAWYDQGRTFTSPVGIATFGDVQQSGGVTLRQPMNATEAQIVRRNNYAATAFTDAQLGRMLSALDELNLTSSTLVVSFGDHGQNLGEHNLWEKMSLFETSTRVHLMIRAPWLPSAAGKTSNVLVELVSLYRTLTELAGISPASIEPGVQGRSFASLLTGAGASSDRDTPPGHWVCSEPDDALRGGRPESVVFKRHLDGVWVHSTLPHGAQGLQWGGGGAPQLHLHGILSPDGGVAAVDLGKVERCHALPRLDGQHQPG